MKKKEDRGSIIPRGVLLPAAAVGAGMFAGSLMGGTAAKALSETPAMVQKLSRMNPAQKREFLRKIKLVTGALGGTAGAGVSGVSYAMLKKELDKREKASQKTAMYGAFFTEMRDSV